MSKPLVSIILPVYNAQNHIARCLESICAQSWQNIEVIVLNDGSKDHSLPVCEEFRARDSRIVLVDKENSGVSDTRNLGLKLASGKYVQFVDSDDYIAPGCYQYLHTLLEEGADIAECDFVETERNDAVFGTDAGEISFYTPLEAMRCHIRDTAFRQLIWNKLYRRETVGDIRFPVGTKIDDEFFTYRVLGNAKRLVRSTRKLYAYRQQPDSVMHGGFSLRRLEGVQAQEQRLAYLKTHMPSLEYEGRANLFLYCQYVMQMSIQYLSGEELRQAKESLRKTVSGLTPLLPSRKLSPAGNVWLVLGQLSFEGSCRLMNCLERRNGKGSE